MTKLLQPNLFGEEPHELTDRQQAAWDLVRATDGGATADEVGAAWHAIKGKHAADVRCRFCAEEGASVLRSKALHDKVIRRRNGVWQPRNPEDAETAASGVIATNEPDQSLNPFADL